MISARSCDSTVALSYATRGSRVIGRWYSRFGSLVQTFPCSHPLITRWVKSYASMDPFTLALSLVSSLLLAYYYLWKPMTRFKQLGIPHEPPIPILGNMVRSLFRRVTLHEHLEQLYHRFSHTKYFGFYNFMTPVIVIRDPELITSIAVKNFDHFCDHRGFIDEESDPLVGKNLFALRGDYWRDMRRLLSPTFTASKLKTMFHLIDDCADNFTDFVANESKEGQVLEMKEMLGRYTNDVVSSCNFGLIVDSMRNPENEFYSFAKEVVDFMSSLSLKLTIGKNFPMMSKLLGIRMFTEDARQYFRRIIADTVQTREEKGVYRPDMIQLMLEAKQKDGKGLTIDEMTCQAFVFFIANFDTVSTILSYAAYEIALNPDVQTKLRAEIEEVMSKTNGKPTYDLLKDMQYMDALISETLRLYALLPFLDRVCVKEFQLPATTPGSRPITIKPDEYVWFLPFALQRDPKYFSNPTKFDPDRFLSNDDIHQSTYMPFGLGPRICIGNRFALIQCKMALFYLIWRCELEPCDKTAIPLVFSSKSFILLAKEGFWLNVRTRNKSYRSKTCQENGRVTNGKENETATNKQFAESGVLRC